MNCLNCNNEMINYLAQTKSNQIEYDFCESCGSLWLDSGELNKMAFQVAGSIEYSSKDKVKNFNENKKDCPRCEQTKLDKVTFVGYSDIILDLCDNCGGFWLDGGELDLVNKELEEIMPVTGKGFSEFVNNIHLPFWHKKIKRKSSETDFYYEVKAIKNSKFISETNINCPDCNSNLNLYTLFDVKFEGCLECNGLFLDKNELRKLKDNSKKSSWGNLRWMDDEIEAIEQCNHVPSKIKCPKCIDTRMITTIFKGSNIIIDYCLTCKGIWLDKNEYKNIIENLSDKLDKLSSKEMTEKLKEEIKEIWNGPENLLSEILDAWVAFIALRNIKIYENPALFKTLRDIAEIGKFL